MKCYAVIENVQEGIEAGNGGTNVLGLFLINPDEPKKALEKAERCLRDRYAKVVADKGEGFEWGNEPSIDEDTGLLAADWVCKSNDTAHFLDIRESDIIE